MKKKYSLDFSITRDTDRLRAVEEIIDGLEKDPTPSELEQMANYILYGKDENGNNSVSRHESKAPSKRYNSYKTSEDKVLSLDEILENPLFDEQQIRSAHQRNPYKKSENTIKRPRYDKEGNLIDPGDSDIPGMVELWDTIDRWQRKINILQGKIAPTEDDIDLDDSAYRVYRLKHNLIDIRRHQYYLKDSYKPTLHFQKMDHPKTQYYDWSGDSFYWISREAWQQRIDNSYSPLISHNIEDYEVREDGMVKWVVCEHNFDWENPKHVRALMNNWTLLYDNLHEKLDTYGCTLLWDFERYAKLSDFTPLRQYMLDLKLKKIPYTEISQLVQENFGIAYNFNHLSTILNTEIPNRIAFTAKRERLLVEIPKEQWQTCSECGNEYPLDSLFFNRNSSRKNGYFSYCKACARKLRVERGQNAYDKRLKDAPMSQM